MRTLFFLLLFISIFSKVNAVVNFTANKVCFGTYTTFAASSSYPDTSILFYKWDFNNDGNFNDATGDTIQHLFLTSQTFQVRVRVQLKNGLPGDTSAYKAVTVNPMPEANFITENKCQGRSVFFQSVSTITGDNIVHYYWDFNNDNIVDDQSGSQVFFNFGPSGTYVSKLIIESSKGCKAVTSKSTVIYPQPEAKFNIQNACVDDVAVFTNQSVLVNENMLYYLWNFGEGQGISTDINPAYSYKTAGNYHTQLICVTSHNCKDTFLLDITVNPRLTMAFTLSGDTVMYEGNILTVTPSGNFNNIAWSTGVTTPIINIVNDGVYTATASNNFGCSITKSVTVKVIQVDEPIIANNVITPNADGINDVMIIENRAKFVICRVIIYNIHGDIVFSENNYNNNWDGKMNGKLLDAGAYYYVVETEKKNFPGCINVLR